LTIEAQALRLLTKCLRPLPEKWHGLLTLRRAIASARRFDGESGSIFIRSVRAFGSLRRFRGARFLEAEIPW
jgi:lysyl-tRNA synthetase class II